MKLSCQKPGAIDEHKTALPDTSKPPIGNIEFTVELHARPFILEGTVAHGLQHADLATEIAVR